MLRFHRTLETLAVLCDRCGALLVLHHDDPAPQIVALDAFVAAHTMQFCDRARCDEPGTAAPGPDGAA